MYFFFFLFVCLWVGGFFWLLFLCLLLGVERAGRETSQQCALESQDEKGSTVKSIGSNGLLQHQRWKQAWHHPGLIHNSHYSS